MAHLMQFAASGHPALSEMKQQGKAFIDTHQRKQDELKRVARDNIAELDKDRGFVAGLKSSLELMGPLFSAAGILPGPAGMVAKGMGKGASALNSIIDGPKTGGALSTKTPKMPRRRREDSPPRAPRKRRPAYDDDDDHGHGHSSFDIMASLKDLAELIRAAKDAKDLYDGFRGGAIHNPDGATKAPAPGLLGRTKATRPPPGLLGATHKGRKQADDDPMAAIQAALEGASRVRIGGRTGGLLTAGAVRVKQRRARPSAGDLRYVFGSLVKKHYAALPASMPRKERLAAASKAASAEYRASR